MDTEEIIEEAKQLLGYLGKRKLNNFNGILVMQTALTFSNSLYAHESIKQMERDGTGG